MSQIFVPLNSGNLPPDVPTSFVAQNNGVNNGSATPAANTINFNVTSSTDNNTNGMQASAAGSTVLHQLTNRITGTATTTDGVTPVNAYTFNLGATPGTYLFNIKIVAYNVTDALSAGYTTFATYKTDGATATFLDSGNDFTSEEGAMVALNLQTSGVGNTIQLNIVGLAGKTINYVALTEYIFAS